MTLHSLAHTLIVWSSEHLLSLCVTHVPSALNTGAELQRKSTLWGVETQSHNSPPCLKVSVYLFASYKNTISSFLFPKKIEGKTLGELTHGQAHCYKSFPEQVEGAVAFFDFDCSILAQRAMDDGSNLSSPQPAVDTAFAQGPGVTGVTEQLAETCT